MTPSVATDFFEGKAFADWKKNRDNELKLQAAIINRLDNVIRASEIVAKTVAKTAR